MNMKVFASVFSAISIASLAPALAGDEAGAAAYQRCAACHLPNGAGVPGAFPALAGRVAHAAGKPEGRDYLVMTVAVGVMGEVDVDGKKIRGIMPAQAGMSDADIAAALNHAAELKPIGAEAAASAKPFTASEVSEIRSRHKGATPNSVHAIRGDVFAAAMAPASANTEATEK